MPRAAATAPGPFCHQVVRPCADPPKSARSCGPEDIPPVSAREGRNRSDSGPLRMSGTQPGPAATRPARASRSAFGVSCRRSGRPGPPTGHPKRLAVGRGGVRRDGLQRRARVSPRRGARACGAAAHRPPAPRAGSGWRAARRQTRGCRRAPWRRAGRAATAAGPGRTAGRSPCRA